ncbi:hypothetical protein F442_20153 [Phytophthora nicotianae P10297]|uniref:Uncharacterized protein n=1 Tax=Phytophthora nicotianae P10297 TaxID=1317064 RepID=W2Y7H1_PHYNI|nr:hypothetical protein F442_20153 [Phytophthora nicotianae P10297]
MELSAKLRDAEQQLTRALQAIELHVERANASLRTNGGQECELEYLQCMLLYKSRSYGCSCARQCCRVVLWLRGLHRDQIQTC